MKVMQRVAWVREWSIPKAIFPQDEYCFSGRLREMINEMSIAWVFTLADTKVCSQIYKGIDPDRVRFRRILPGYLNSDIVREIERLSAENSARVVDIGCRA